MIKENHKATPVGLDGSSSYNSNRVGKNSKLNKSGEKILDTSGNNVNSND